jgi:hypothetical protein
LRAWLFDEHGMAQPLRILRDLGFLPFIGQGCYCRTPYLRLIIRNQIAQTFRHLGYSARSRPRFPEKLSCATQVLGTDNGSGMISLLPVDNPGFWPGSGVGGRLA